MAEQSQVAVGTTAPDGVTLLDAATLTEVSDLATDHPATDMVLVTGLDQPTLIVAGGDSVSAITIGDDGLEVSEPLTLPGPVSKLIWNESADLVHVVTRTAGGQPTVAVIEPQGLTLFADAVVPFAPVALAMEDRPDVPSAPVRVLAIDADGATATIDGGSNAWAWRLPGVLAGALTVLCLYVLARFVSRRRSVGLAVAGLALLDGMMFVTARIAMNDVYVTLFITAAVTLFAAAWTARWRRPWAVGGALVGVGLLLGLALASKWVGLYAMGGIGLLLLARSGVGRVLVLLGMLAATAVLGAAAISAPDVPDPSMNWTFLLLMLALTALVGAAMVRRPLPLEPNELRNVGAIGVGVGLLGLVAGLVGGITTLAMLGAVTGLAGASALLLRRAPAMVARTAPVTDGTPGFLLPGRGLGLPWLFALGCLTLIPVAVYVLSYLPWVALGNQLVAGVPGTDGQTLLDLTQAMYRYHDELRATHPASSPWWAWMLDLKPVWMYLGDMAGGLTGNIFDAANPLILWSSIGGLVFTGVTAWRRRDAAFALVVVMFLSLWLPWARIDRATFQYHLTGSLPFALLALALLMSTMWHRSSDLALAVGRATIVGISFLPAALWLLVGPLCGLSGVTDPALCATGGAALSTGIILAALGCLPAFLAWRSRNGRHLVVGLAVAMCLVSLALYPSLSGLPIEASLTRWVTSLLPTWDYAWQFSVNSDPPVERSLLDLTALVVGVLAVIVTGVAMAAATRWDDVSRRRRSDHCDKGRRSQKRPGL